MSDLLDFYEEQAQLSRATIPWLSALKARAVQDFKRLGFPSRKDEEWKYTAIDGFLQQRFTSPNQSTCKAGINMDIPVGHQLAIHNGQVVDVAGFIKQLPAGIQVHSLMDALAAQPDTIKPYLGSLLAHEHGFHALNTASLMTGVVIHLSRGIKLDEPLVLAHWQDKNEQAIHLRYLIIAEEGSEATIIETFHGEEDCCYLTNTVTEVFVGAEAKLTHYTIQCESRKAYHIGHVAVAQAALSQFDNHSLSLGGKLVRSDLTFKLEEAKAACSMNGIYLPTGTQHMDHHTSVHHLVPDCTSHQDYKGVLTGQARAVFNGKVVVAKDAQHTRAVQQNKNLLLSTLAEIDTKPQLEIFADDVLCSHGATVGQLDEDALFYLATRGIDREEAMRLLIQAFASDNLRVIPHSPMRDWMANLINQQLR